MQVRSRTKVGFDMILTSEDEASSEFIVPQKKPFVIFRLPLRNDKDFRYFKKLEENNFALLSRPPIRKEGYLYLTVTNEVRIVKAIKGFFKFPNYQIPENKELFAKLKNFAKRCAYAESRKTARRIPPKGELISKYRPVAGEVTQSNSKVVVVEDEAGEHYFLKKIPTGRTSIEFEAFNGFCWQGLIGSRHPDVRAAYDENGNRIGVLSKKIDGFQSIYDRADKIDGISKDVIVNSEMVKVLVSAYCEEEMDLHPDNWGFDGSGFCAKIDPGRSSYSVLAFYMLIDPEKGIEDHEGFETPPVQTFKVSAADIKVFPALLEATPYFWWDKEEVASCFEDDAMVKAAKEKKFLDDKNYTFLKRILMPDSFYHGVGEATISNPNKRALMVALKINKTAELTKVLLNSPKFLDYVCDNPDAVSQIKDEIADFNAKFPEPEDHYLHINYNKIYQRFHQIRRFAFTQKGIDIYAISDMVRDALIGGAAGLAVVGIIALVCLLMCLTFPLMGLSLGAMIASACLIPCATAGFAMGVGLLIKRSQSQKASNQQMSSIVKETTGRVQTVLDVAPSAKATPEAGISLVDVLLTSSSENLTPITNPSTSSSISPVDEELENEEEPEEGKEPASRSSRSASF